MISAKLAAVEGAVHTRSCRATLKTTQDPPPRGRVGRGLSPGLGVAPFLPRLRRPHDPQRPHPLRRLRGRPRRARAAQERRADSPPGAALPRAGYAAGPARPSRHPRRAATRALAERGVRRVRPGSQHRRQEAAPGAERLGRLASMDRNRPQSRLQVPGSGGGRRAGSGSVGSGDRGEPPVERQDLGLAGRDSLVCSARCSALVGLGRGEERAPGGAVQRAAAGGRGDSQF